MLLEVAIQVGLLAEAAVTEWTAERTFSVVDVPDVTLKVGRDAETSTTVLAAVRLFTRVGTQMTGEVGRAWERLAAISARVPVSLSHPGPRHHPGSHTITVRHLGGRLEGHDVWKIDTD